MLGNRGYKCGVREAGERSAHGHGDLLGERLAVRGGGSEGVSGCFSGLYVHAETVRRPDRAGLRLQGYGFGVGHAEANLGGLAAADFGCGVEHLDGQGVAAKLLDGGLIRFMLFLGLCVADTLVVLLVLAVARKENPAEVDGRDQDQKGKEGEGTFEEGFLRCGVLIFGEHRNGGPFFGWAAKVLLGGPSNINAAKQFVKMGFGFAREGRVCETQCRLKSAGGVMRAWRSVALTVGMMALVFGGEKVVIAQTAAGGAAGNSFEKFAEEFWTWRAATQPFSADDIPRIERPGGKRDWSRAAIEKQREKLGEFEGQWKKLEGIADAGDRARQVDYRLMGSALARVRWELYVNPRWKRDPNFYVDQSLCPLVEALVVPPPFDEARSRELLVRVRNIPEIVKVGEINLEKPPAPFARVAMEALDGVKAKLVGMGAALSGVTTIKREEWDVALDQAGTALDEYRGWLQKKLPESPEKTEVGRDAYIFFLQHVALMPYTPEQLLEMSDQEWARTVAFETYEAARDRSAPELKMAPDTEAWIHNAAADERDIRKFLEARGILSVQKDVPHYTLRPMPEYLRAVGAFGETDDFTGPSRLHQDCVRYVEAPSEKMGFFWRATAEDPRPITVHEGVPGHYFQLSVSWRNADPIRRHYYDSGANEGIGFYAEEMMLQAGLFDDSPRTREIIYHFMRLRALRVQVDVKLALGMFTLEQSAEYLESRVPMDRGTARSEAIMFATTPGQAISYQVGKMQITEFLAEARRQEGEEFSLRKFHDFVWSNGNVPIALQRWEYLGLR